MFRLFFLLFCLSLLGGCQRKKPTYQVERGIVFGTTWTVQYYAAENLQKEIVRSLEGVNEKFSTFDSLSEISRFNRSDKGMEVSSEFAALYKKAHSISEQTDGAFDLTVGNLVNAWGFGTTPKMRVTEEALQEILSVTGFRKVTLAANNFLSKKYPKISLTMSAIAKGYGVDCVAELLEQHGIAHYLVEIGGEIRCKGTHLQKKRDWIVGIEDPLTGEKFQAKEYKQKISFKEGGLATSGNYRQFYMQDGKRYAHTISPATGRPIQTDVLSATVKAAECATADALATACMVLGSDRSLEIIEGMEDVEVYLICTSADSLKVIMSGGFQPLIRE